MPTSHDRRPPDPDVHRYELPGDWEVLAGKTELDNELLSLKVARPGDWWFHVRGMPGSHVILRHAGDGAPDRDTLRAAAAIAAWHSKARSGGLTAVSCTQAKHVSKPRGARPGTVTIRREKVIRVRPALPS